jgi:hypothetical protein
MIGRAVAQAISHRLPTAAARVRAQDSLCGICGGQRGIGSGFLRVLRLPLPIIPATAPHPSSSSSSTNIRGWYNRPNSGNVTSELSLTPPQETKNKTKLLDIVCGRPGTFRSCDTSRAALEPTQSPMQWSQWVLPLAVKHKATDTATYRRG